MVGSSAGLLDGLGRLELLYAAGGWVDVDDVAGDLHCITQERTGFTTGVLGLKGDG